MPAFNAILATNNGASLTLPDANVVTIDDAYAPLGGNVIINGTNVPNGTFTFAIAVVGGILYAQDGSSGSGGQWYSDTGETAGNFVAVAAPPGLVYFGATPPAYVPHTPLAQMAPQQAQ